MKLLGNILWFLFGGLESGLLWVAYGILWCITIVGIPLGVQCFKFASLAFWPFNKEVRYGGGTMSLLLNILWLVFSGLPLAVAYAVAGVIWCITILGIPFGKQCFKLARLSLTPFGAEVV